MKGKSHNLAVLGWVVDGSESESESESEEGLALTSQQRRGDSSCSPGWTSSARALGSGLGSGCSCLVVKFVVEWARTSAAFAAFGKKRFDLRQTGVVLRTRVFGRLCVASGSSSAIFLRGVWSEVLVAGL
jgi:hypothetical protein